MLIDCHVHILPEAALRRLPDGDSPRYVTAERRVLDRLLAAHEAAGVTHALLSDSFYLENAAEALPDWSPDNRMRLYNDALAELLARFPGRFFGLGCLDPFAGEAAARELERAVRELGFAGGLVRPSDGQRYLDHPVAEPLLAAAARLGAPLFIHPSRDIIADAPSNDFALGVAATRPAQTTICVARLIYTGALDRHPDLRVLLAHGGGTLPFVAGRLDATWTAYRAAQRWDGPDLLERPPSSYLRRFHVDSNTWSAPALRLLLELLGPDRLLVGSDQPPVWFPLDQGLAPLGNLGLSPQEAEAVHWRNAARLFSLPLSAHS